VADLIQLLRKLVAIPTANPGGEERRMCDLLHDELRVRGADIVEVVDVGAHAYVWARWGMPSLLVNAHIDTVPADAGWSTDPWQPWVDGDRVIGLGAADTKGAIAAILCALDETQPRDTMILFSGDEELGGSCVRAFLDSGRGGGIERAIVCEPTGCRAGVRHRGVIALEAELAGEGGHSSKADELVAPVAELARVAAEWHAWGRSRRDKGPEGFRGMCMNIARLEGGVAFNVVPREARLTASLRPPPGAAVDPIADELIALATKTAPAAKVDAPLRNPSFATRDLPAFRALLGRVADQPIDLGFWTEAAVLAGAGIDCVVYGPGDIGRAHRADELVPVADLESARATFAAAFKATHGTG
jgi:acetylornithine deacetylase